MLCAAGVSCSCSATIAPDYLISKEESASYENQEHLMLRSILHGKDHSATMQMKRAMLSQHLTRTGLLLSVLLLETLGSGVMGTVHDAQAQPPPSIQHIIFIVQENRSFRRSSAVSTSSPALLQRPEERISSLKLGL
jgi:phospholipase C